MSTNDKSYSKWFWASTCVILAYTIIFLGMLYTAAKKADGNIVSPIDDTYIHMAMAKNLAHHGIWGVSPVEFSSTSSSIGYTLLLGFLFYIFGETIVMKG